MLINIGDVIMGRGDLASLISERKGDRSYRRLERDAGGTPSAGRWQQLERNPIRDFQKPDTIYGISRALGVTVTEVVMATARSLGVQVREDSTGSLSTEGLTDDQVDVVRRVITALAERTEAAQHGTPIAPPKQGQSLEEVTMPSGARKYRGRRHSPAAETKDAETIDLRGGPKRGRAKKPDG